jgi:hypothetical protein
MRSRRRLSYMDLGFARLDLGFARLDLGFARLAFAGLAILTACAGCGADKGATATTCCKQPEIPAGVAPFTIVADETSGPSDGQRVLIRAALATPTKRDAVYPVLHTLYRHAMKRGPFEPIDFVAEVYPNETLARGGNEAQMAAKISRSQTQNGPACDNRVPYDFGEQVARAFDASLGRLPEESLDDTCRLSPPKKRARVDENFKHKASYKFDPGAKTVEVTYPFLAMGKDEYVEKLKLSSAFGDWIDITTSLFRKVPDLAGVAFSGLHNDVEVLRVNLSRQQFDADFAGLQETIAAHAAVTFQSLGTGRASDKSAEKEQETFKLKTYKEALAALPKHQVTISSKLAKGK